MFAFLALPARRALASPVTSVDAAPAMNVLRRAHRHQGPGHWDRYSIEVPSLQRRRSSLSGDCMNVDVCARWLAIVLCALGVSVPAAAQLTTGSVAGKISNVQGPVPAAVVTLTSETRGNKLPDATTNAAGEFVILGVPA